jgi:hypothetical protein
MYFPKSRIVEGLYTNGGEYVFKQTKETYVGYYHKFYTGKIFTGKTSKSNPKFELVPTLEGIEKDQLSVLNTEGKIALFLNDPDPEVDKEKWDQSAIVTYLRVKGLPTNKENPRKIPQSFYPSPTEKDYEKTYFIRYFAAKINERDSFVEISKETYDKLKSEDKKWMWDRYIVFEVIWTITAETEDKVSEINRNILYLVQRRIQRNGLIAFLRGNYSKFFKSKAQIKLDFAPKSEIKKSQQDPIPNTEPIPPSVSNLRSEKFFKEEKIIKEKTQELETKEFNRKAATSVPNQPQPFRGKKINPQLEIEETEALEEGSVPPPTTDQRTSRSTGGY